MATKKKMLQAAAGQAGGAGLDVTDVFSTYLYEGNGSSQTITNGIDLVGEGGLVWLKSRETTDAQWVFDTHRGVNKALKASDTSVELSLSNSVTSFNSEGFSLGSSVSASSRDYVSWAFRKAPKFFDIVTYTGDGIAGRKVSHNLGTTPGLIAIKGVSNSGDWSVYHRSISNPTVNRLQLHSANSTSSGHWDNTAPTSTEFTLSDSLDVNGLNRTFVAYLFAHNEDDGNFGPGGDQDVIKCGGYVGNGLLDGPDVEIGFEPQWLVVKRVDSTGSWFVWDVMRGMTALDSGDPYLLANSEAAETGNTTNHLSLQSTGFKLNTQSPQLNINEGEYIYIAIRRGPLAPPESGTEVFSVNAGSFAMSSEVSTGFAVDLHGSFERSTSASGFPGLNLNTRLAGLDTQGDPFGPGASKYLNTSSVGAENSFNISGYAHGNTSYKPSTWFSNINTLYLDFKRAPSFFDIVAYTGNGTAGRTVSHNLGVAPEMMWVKSRGAARLWAVYNSASGPTKWLRLDSTNAETTSNIMWNDTSPTDSVFSVGSSTAVNNSGENYIAYLFASLDGVSKVGSYTGTGSALNIDCGFSSGARFVLIKKTSGTGDWGVFDTARGITDSSSPLLRLNNTTAEANFDYLDPYSGGFAHSGANLTFNAVGAEYIFYAIA